jgi:hypothetical protein
MAVLAAVSTLSKLLPTSVKVWRTLSKFYWRFPLKGVDLRGQWDLKTTVNGIDQPLQEAFIVHQFRARFRGHVLASSTGEAARYRIYEVQGRIEPGHQFVSYRLRGGGKLGEGDLHEVSCGMVKLGRGASRMEGYAVTTGITLDDITQIAVLATRRSR